MNNLQEVFGDADSLLDLVVEDLAGVLLPLLPAQRFTMITIINELYPPTGGGFLLNKRDAVTMAIAEAMDWLRSQGLVMLDPTQPAEWWLLTRRGLKVRVGNELAVFRRGQALPVHLLHPRITEKVRGLFYRGSYDTAVFEAFKELEVTVRRASALPALNGKKLMSAAFNPDKGPLTDTSIERSEQEGEMNLFVGAYLHGRNPPAHRNVGHSPEKASSLIVLASYLLSLVEED